MKAKLTFFIIVLLLIPFNIFAETSINDILVKVEKKYRYGFTCDFEQKSTLTAIDVTDTATGMAMFKRPGKMRWEYIKPNKQLIISNGKRLWIYQPAEKQVSVGSAPAIFGDGKGASFLSDITLIRKKFKVSMTGSGDAGHYGLKLIPIEMGKIDIKTIFLVISKDFIVKEIKTVNLYEDETLISLKNIKFKKDLKDSSFEFVPPKDADVVDLTKNQ